MFYTLPKELSGDERKKVIPYLERYASNEIEFESQLWDTLNSIVVLLEVLEELQGYIFGPSSAEEELMIETISENISEIKDLIASL